MLRNMQEIEGFAIGATDGILGQVRDFYFDDESWVVRYVIVQTGDWHANHRTLISPMAMGMPNWTEKLIPTALTQEQVRNAPDVDTDKPVSRQQEMGYLGYYGYPDYWGGGGLWGAGMYPDILQGGLDRAAGGRGNRARHQGPGRADDLHLRSANSVLRYYVHATDGDIGHVQGLLVEERTWAIRYVIVNTSNWWLGHEVLIAPAWIDDVYWAESKLMLGLTRASLREAPAYDSKAPLTRDQEKRLHEFHGQGGYWRDESEEHAAAASKPQ